MADVFPGRVVKRGEEDSSLVAVIQKQLELYGYGPFQVGVFDVRMESTVKLYQAQNVDRLGRPLLVDGVVGLYTWASLFFNGNEVFPTVGMAEVPSSPLTLQALAVAATQIGQRESPPHSNRGPMVDQYLRSVGIDPSRGTPDDRYWCMAFVYWCFEQAAENLQRACPLPRTGGCVNHWNKAGQIPGVVLILRDEAYAERVRVRPGSIFILDYGGPGHTGIVEQLSEDGSMVSIEGNTNNDLSRNGIGVFRLTHRKLSDPHLLGFIDYSKC